MSAASTDLVGAKQSAFISTFVCRQNSKALSTCSRSASRATCRGSTLVRPACASHHKQVLLGTQLLTVRGSSRA